MNGAGIVFGFDAMLPRLLKGLIVLANIKSTSSISQWASHSDRDSKVQFEFAEVEMEIKKTLFVPGDYIARCENGEKIFRYEKCALKTDLFTIRFE